jgi:hypothetical protein
MYIGLGCLSHFQQYFRYMVAVSFIDGGNGVPGETTDPPQVTANLYHLMLYGIQSGIRTSQR